MDCRGDGKYGQAGEQPVGVGRDGLDEEAMGMP